VSDPGVLPITDPPHFRRLSESWATIGGATIDESDARGKEQWKKRICDCYVWNKEEQRQTTHNQRILNNELTRCMSRKLGSGVLETKGIFQRKQRSKTVYNYELPSGATCARIDKRNSVCRWRCAQIHAKEKTRKQSKNFFVLIVVHWLLVFKVEFVV